MDNDVEAREQSASVLTPLEFSKSEDLNHNQADLLFSLYLSAVNSDITKAEYDDFNGREISLALQRLAAVFPDKFDIHEDNLADLTRRFMDRVVPNPPGWGESPPGWEGYKPRTGERTPSKWEMAWTESLSLQKIVIDALLARAEQESLQNGNSNDQKIIRQARELLRLPNYGFLSESYQGTSSTSLAGIEEFGGKILSRAELLKRGITRRTGEGLKGGASARVASNEGISVSEWFEAGETYADLCCDYFHQSPEKIRDQLAKTEQMISYWQGVLDRPEEIYNGHYSAKHSLGEWLERKKLIEEELVELMLNPVPSTEPPFPVVFGFTDLPIVRREKSGQANFRTEHVIDLQSKLKAVYAPMEKTEEITDWMSCIDIDGGRVYPLESVVLIRKMNPDWEYMRTEMKNFALMIRSRAI